MNSTLERKLDLIRLVLDGDTSPKVDNARAEYVGGLIMSEIVEYINPFSSDEHDEFAELRRRIINVIKETTK